MSAFLYMTGTSRGDALNCIMRGVSQAFINHGFEAIEVNLMQPDVFVKLGPIIAEKNVLFALTFAGIGKDITLPGGDGKQDYLWDSVNIPFITINGDSPAYYFDRHVNNSPNFATFYAFREHYDLRKTLPHFNGVFGQALPAIFDGVPRAKIDFAAKERGKLVFLKNAGNPENLRQLWKEKLSSFVYRTLCEVADVLVANMATDPHVDIDQLVTSYFKLKSIDIDQSVQVRLFFVAQLDDYLRRVKSTFIANVLRQFPVEIHGDNWDHLDFNNSPCKIVHGCDYKTSDGIIANSLGIIDMSPNTGGGFHDRPVRAFGRHTLCLTNEQDCFAETFGPDCGITFTFDRDVLAAKIAQVLAHPKEYVEIGIEVARIFNERYPAEAVVRQFVETADILRLANTKHISGMQDFFVWPPQMIK